MGALTPANDRRLGELCGPAWPLPEVGLCGFLALLRHIVVVIEILQQRVGGVSVCGVVCVCAGV